MLLLKKLVIELILHFTAKTPIEGRFGVFGVSCSASAALYGRFFMHMTHI